MMSSTKPTISSIRNTMVRANSTAACPASPRRADLKKFMVSAPHRPHGHLPVKSASHRATIRGASRQWKKGQAKRCSGDEWNESIGDVHTIQNECGASGSESGAGVPVPAVALQVVEFVQVSHFAVCPDPVPLTPRPAEQT